jgi:hypothetical protein
LRDAFAEQAAGGTEVLDLIADPRLRAMVRDTQRRHRRGRIEEGQ